MATVRDLIQSSLKEIGVLAAGEVATAADATDAYAMLNRMVDGWGIEKLQIYTVTRTTWTITSGTGQYTIGSGGTVAVARPIYIEALGYVDSAPTPDAEYIIPRFTEQQWADITQKAQTADQPQGYYYNPVYPLGTIDFWPVPTSTTLSGVIYIPTALSQFTGLTQTVALPPGYEEMIVTNLAVRLCPTFGRQATADLLRQAVDSKANVKRANKRIVDMKFDPGALVGGQTYDIYTDL